MPTIGGIDIPDVPRPSLGAVFGGAAQAAYGQLRYGLPYQVAKLQGPMSAEDEAFYQRGLAETSAAAAATAPAGVSDVTGGKVGIGRFIAENLAASVPYMAGGVVGAVGGGLVGGVPGAVVGAVAGGVPQFSASNVARAVEEEGGLSQAAAERSLIAAPFQSAADAAIGRFLPGAGKLIGDVAATQAGGFLTRTAKSIVKAGATEAITEAAQQVGERYAAGIDVTSADAAGEYVNAAVTAFAVGGVLGAGGGFRRTNAHAKPPSEVTNDDINEAINNFLALPAPADMIAGANGTRVNPAGTTQLALPSPEQFAQPAAPITVDPEGIAATPEQLEALRTAPGAVPGAVDAPTGADLAMQSEIVGYEPQRLQRAFADALAAFEPEVPAALAAPTPPAAVAPVDLRGSTSTNAIVTATRPDDSQVIADPVDVPATRVFADSSFDELLAATKAKDAEPALKAEAETEIANRYAEAQGRAPLTGEFKTRLDEVKSGLRGSWVTKLEATSPADLREKVYDRIFVDQDTASSVQKLAQRIGVLDENLEMTQAAKNIEVARSTAARLEAEGVDPNAVNTASRPTERQVQALALKARRESLAANNAQEFGPAEGQTERRTAAPTEVKFLYRREGDVAPAATEAVVPPAPPAPVQVAPAAEVDEEVAAFRALGADRASAREGAATKAERVAQQLGLVTNDSAMDITPKGRRVFLRSSEGFEETANAARELGYTGTAASAFDRGVRAVVRGEDAGTVSTAEDTVALEAGKVWAQRYIDTPGVASAAETSLVQQRQAARGTARPGERPAIDPAQVQRQALNGLIANADLTGIADQDVVALKRLVAEGADAQTVGQAIQRLQGGETLRQAPPRRAPQTAPVRGQPIFREMNTQEPTGSKADARAQTEAAVRAFDLRNLVEFARSEGGLTDARAQKLHDLLDAGNVDQVKRLLKDFDPDAAPTAPRKRLPTPPETVAERSGGKWTGQADEAFEAAVTGKTFMEVVDHMIEAAPSKYHREIMRKVKSLAQATEKAGVTLGFNVVNPGDMVPRAMLGERTRGFAQVLREPPSSTVWLKGSAMGKDFGTNYQIAAHEMLHAVTMVLIQQGETKAAYGNTALGKAARDLTDLGNAIINHFNARAAAGDMTQFERSIYDRSINAVDNQHEILAWGLTNPDMQRYLQNIEYQPRQSVFAKLVDLLRSLLGLDGKYETALTELLRVSENILGTRGAELAQAYTFGRNQGTEQAMLEAPAMDGSRQTRTVQDTNGVTADIAARVGQFAEQINLADKGVKTRRALLGMISHNQMDRQFGDRAPWLIEHSDAHRSRTAVRGRWENIGDAAHQQFEVMKREKPKIAEQINDLMDRATAFQLDPDKSFEDHEHHKDAKNKGALKRIHAELVKVRNDLSRGDGAGIKLFNEFRTLNEAQNYARLTATMHSLISMDPELTMGISQSAENPMDAFMLQPDIVSSSQLRGWWQQALQRQIAAATAFVNQKKGEVATANDSERAALRQQLSPIEMMLTGTHEAIAGMAKAPYFHLGRFGDNFGAATIRANADGTVDTAAQRHVAEALAKAGFDDVQISADNTKPKISMRFDTVDQTRRFKAVALELQRQGWLSSDPITAGPRDRSTNYGAVDGLPSYVSDYIQRIESSPMFVPAEGASAAERAALAQQQEEAVRLAVDTWLEAQPDSSISKVLAKRYTVAGYNRDMVRNFAHRWTVGSTSLASVSSGPKFNRAYVNARAAINEATDAANGGDPDLQADLFSEVQRRDTSDPFARPSDFSDKLRAASHAYFLGMSPAYGLINMTQLGVVALPELAKQHGYAKSFHAMRRSSATALKVLSAAIGEARSKGWENAADVTLSEAVLQKVGLSKNQLDFVRHMLATGSIDIGTSALALGQYAKGGEQTATQRAARIGLKYAGAIGLYTETFSRLTAALAAHELHGGSTAESAAYATNVVSNSMFDYQNWNTARQLGKQGFAGPITPLLTQFMSYSIQMTEKLYSEVLGSFAKPRPGESAEATKARKAESRRFLMGHLTAVTALAGSLGLPFATVFAAVIERLVDQFDDDDDPFDATAAYRGFLADVLGKDFAEVVSRGLPRALGFDISARAGEQNLLPFSEFLADRRPWKEAVESSAGRSLGAVPSMISNIITGGGKIADGDLLGGMKDALPVAFKGPLEAYRLTDQGYVDSRGTKLPMTPGSSAILWQLLGFSPSARAEYGEARGDQAARRGVITREAGLLRSGIVRAVMSGDSAKAKELIARAQQFDLDNPSFAVIPSLAGSIQRQQTNQLQARTARSPLGVSMNDVAGQGLTSYANVNYQ